MKDEIKDLLQYLKNVYESEETSTWLNKLQIKDLLDYITNLQEENKRLKEENKHIFANVNDDQLLRSNAMNYAELQDYKTRNEKAVEYINKLTTRMNVLNYQISDLTKKNLLNILQGKSDE